MLQNDEKNRSEVMITKGKFSVLIVVFLAMTLMSNSASAQDILLDHPVKCGRLLCFPSANNELEYYYLPSNPHVALNENNKHEFSFTRYVEDAPDTEGKSGGLKEAEGGGIVHFLVDYTVPDSRLEVAEQALQDITRDAVLRGPIIFDAGNFVLVSSFAPEVNEPTELTQRVIGVGRAPLIEGLKAAVSMHLTKKGSQILWSSFQMSTPDVSLVFEMSFSGFNDPAEATITANWEKLQNIADVTLGAKASYMGIGGSFDYGNFWDEARSNGAMSIEYRGDPDKLQGIIDRAYARLHEIMFEPIPIEDTADEGDDDPLQSMLAVTNAAAQQQQGGSANYSMPWEVKINGGYKRRKVTRTGTFKLDFRQRSRSQITTAMAGNIGNMFQLYGNDPTVFRVFNISRDPEFRVREISIGLDARDEQEFSKYINHVTLSMRKQHGSGDATLGEVTIARRNYESGRPQRLRYRWSEEPSVDDWLRYEYKADWSFVGGVKYSTDWMSTDSAAITLTPPYQYREVEFVTSPDILSEADVRMVSVRVTHEFFGREVSETINILPSRQEYTVKKVFAVPPGKDSIDYKITWTLNDRRKIRSDKLSSDEAIIFCDEIPQA
jgi:hypothetical protein